MEPTITIYIGHPVSRGEALAVRRLCSALTERGKTAILLVNFTAKSRQIDCVVITPRQALLLDFKEISGPVRGGKNGPWFIRSHNGAEVRYPGENPYVEVSGAKYALSDEMSRFQKSASDIPPPIRDRFFQEVNAAVCVCPQISDGSALDPGDFKCYIWDLPRAVNEVCTQNMDSSWTLDHWKVFAQRHLLLERVSLDAATDSNFRQAEQTLQHYSSRMEAIFQFGLPPLPTNTSALLPLNENLTVVGPSGIGKTVLLQHYALGCLKRSTMVLFAEAMHYDGEFRSLLQKCVSPFFPGKIEDLKNCASNCAKPIALIIDGFDRCKPSLESNLILDIHAFHERTQCQIIISTKSKLDLPPTIHARTVHIEKLTIEQKLAIFKFHSGDALFAQNELLHPFQTAHELMVAGKCRSTLAQGATRNELYDRYITKCLPARHATVAGALCRHLAALMSREFTGTLSLQDFENHSERFLKEVGGALDVADEIRQSCLVRVSHGDISFSHELIQDHLYGEWLWRSFEDVGSLVAELQKPINRNLTQSLLSREKSHDRIRILLMALPDSGLFMESFHGRCGATAKEVIVGDLHALLRDASADLVNLQVVLDPERDNDESDRQVVQPLIPKVHNTRLWNRYELTMADVLGKLVDTNEFAEEVAELLTLSGASLQNAASALAQTLGRPSGAIVSKVLSAHLQGAGNLGKVLISDVLLSRRSSRFAISRSECATNLDGPWARALISRSNHECFGSRAAIAFALCELLPRGNTFSLPLVEKVFALSWDSRMRSLRMEAVNMLCRMTTFRANMSEEELQKIRALVEQASASAGNKDVFMNTFILEAMNEFEMIDTPVTLETALHQMRSVLDPESKGARSLVEIQRMTAPQDVTDPLAEYAYNVVGLFFEEIYHGVYLEAFEILSEVEQIAFMNLAAKADNPEFHLSFILSGLLEAESDLAMPAFQRHAASVKLDTPFLQDSVESFILATTGCAGHETALPSWKMERTTALDGWRVIRDLIYENAKKSPCSRTVSDIWVTLQTETRLAAADVLFHLHRSAMSERSGSLVRRIFDEGTAHVVNILDYSLRHRHALTSAIGIRDSDHHKDERARFIIQAIGDCGTSASIATLKTLVEDGTLGSCAIDAIKAIINRND